MAERAEEEKHERRIDAQAREILRTERRILTVADFMALMMVAATAFTALATWRTYKVSELIFAISDRPFLGVQRVTFERTDTAEPGNCRRFPKLRPDSRRWCDHRGQRAARRQADPASRW